ncbi:MAG TPA: hypothetical protein VGK59_23770 [Ohtaekwangia sp.]
MRKNNLTTIPTRKHLKKFLLRYYDTREPVMIDNHTSLGRAVLSALVLKMQYVPDGHDHNDTLQLQLSSRVTERTLRTKQLITINNHLDEMFEEALITWIHAQGTEGVNPNLACKSFLSFFKIEESEYSYDAAYKRWQRFKTRAAEKLKKNQRKCPKKPAKVSGRK